MRCIHLVTILTSALIGDITGPHGVATVEPKSDTLYWAGEARLGDQSWQLDLTSTAESVWVSVPSLWSPRQRPQNFKRTGRVIRFDFPLDIGTVEIRLDPNARHLVGNLQARTGALGSVRLTKRRVPTFSTEDFVVRRDGIAIAATASVPFTRHAKPAVVILHGGGNSSRADSPPYRFWGEYFARNGYVAVTYDKRGNGQSAGAWQTVGFSERAEDVLALVAWLRMRPDVDPDRVGFFSVSQGTWVATLAAARDPRIRFVVQVSGPVVSPFEADTYATLNSWRAAGLSARELDDAERMWRQEVDVIRRPGDSTSWNRYVAADLAARSESWYRKSRYAPSKPDGWFTTWYRLVSDFDPVPHLRLVNAPVLWMYGASDTQSDIPRNLQIIEQLRANGRTQSEVATFSHTGHGMLAPVDSLGRARGPLATPPKFFETLERWLARHVNHPR